MWDDRVGHYRVLPLSSGRSHAASVPPDGVYRLFSYCIVNTQTREALGIFDSLEHAYHVAFCLALMDLQEVVDSDEFNRSQRQPSNRAHPGDSGKSEERESK